MQYMEFSNENLYTMFWMEISNESLYTMLDVTGSSWNFKPLNRNLATELQRPVIGN
jgi:hypothetical protein